MPRSVYTVLKHRYRASSYDSNPWKENNIEVMSSHVSLRAANQVVIDEMDLDSDLDRDIAGESRHIDEEGEIGYVRQVGGRLDAMRSSDVNNGLRIWVVAHSLDERLVEYGDGDDGDEEEEDEEQNEEHDALAVESSLKRSASPQDDEI